MENLSFYKLRLVIHSLFWVTIPCVDTIGGYNGSKPWVNTMGRYRLQYHGYTTYNTMGIPCVDTYHGWMNIMDRCHLQYHGRINKMGGWIPWFDDIYNSMGKFHRWMDNMGRLIPWVDAIFHLDQILEQLNNVCRRQRWTNDWLQEVEPCFENIDFHIYEQQGPLVV